MWIYGCSLRGATRILILSLIAIVVWIRWNERNHVIFSLMFGNVL
jgi:hypothetical protein